MSPGQHISIEERRRLEARIINPCAPFKLSPQCLRDSTPIGFSAWGNGVELRQRPFVRHAFSLQLSLPYAPLKTAKDPMGLLKNVVERRGTELLAPGLQSPRSPS